MYQKNLCNGRTYQNLQKRAKRKGKASELIKINGTTLRLWVIDKANDQQEPFIYILTNYWTREKCLIYTDYAGK